MKYYPDNVWICGDTYDTSLIWKDKTTPKPSEEHLESLWK